MVRADIEQQRDLIDINWSTTGDQTLGHARDG